MIKISEEEVKRRTSRQVAKSMQQIEDSYCKDVTVEQLKAQIKTNFWNLYDDLMGADSDFRMNYRG
jgi:hypothetical protein